MKYARIERERRFLLAELPEGVGSPSQITDHYLLDLRMRLRRVDGPEPAFKLGQKFTPDPTARHRRQMTTLYLTEVEYGVLKQRLAGEVRPLVKTRYPWHRGDRTWVVDVLADGRIIAEVEADEPDLHALAPPPGTLREITDEEALEGASLAARC